MSTLPWQLRVIGLLLVAVTSGRPCQLGLRLDDKLAEGGGRQLQLVPAEPGCHCGTPRLYILVCRDDKLCDEQERSSGSFSWKNLQLAPLTADQAVTVYYAGWYGARSGKCSTTPPFWVEGIDASSWNFTSSAIFKKKGYRDGPLCISVKVAEQFDQSNSNQSISNQKPTGLAFPRLRLCLYEVETMQRNCTVLMFPQLSEEWFCGGKDGLKTTAVYKATVYPYVTAVCWDRLGGCPRRSWRLVVPALSTEEAAKLSSLPSHFSLTLYLGAAVTVAIAVTVACLIYRRMYRALPAPAVLSPAETELVPAAGASALLVTRGPVGGDGALQLRRLRARLVAHGIKALSLQDRETLSHLQRHPCLADALSRPLLHRAFLLFIVGGGGRDGGIQSRLFDSLLQHVRSSQLAYDYQRVFVLSLGGAVPAPPLEDVTRGRLFRVEGDTDLLIRHLIASATVHSNDSDSDNGNSGSDERRLLEDGAQLSKSSHRNLDEYQCLA